MPFPISCLNSNPTYRRYNPNDFDISLIYHVSSLRYETALVWLSLPRIYLLYSVLPLHCRLSPAERPVQDRWIMTSSWPQTLGTCGVDTSPDIPEYNGYIGSAGRKNESWYGEAYKKGLIYRRYSATAGAVRQSPSRASHLKLLSSSSSSSSQRGEKIQSQTISIFSVSYLPLSTGAWEMHASSIPDTLFFVYSSHHSYLFILANQYILYDRVASPGNL